MQAVLAEAEQHFSGVVDLVRVDTDIHPAEAQRWRLRMVPTQILVDASGTELWRHEGYLPFDELRTEVERHRDSGQSGQGQ
jgi:thioredoxin-like negative regulator of GroEL